LVFFILKHCVVLSKNFVLVVIAIVTVVVALMFRSCMMSLCERNNSDSIVCLLQLQPGSSCLQ